MRAIVASLGLVLGCAAPVRPARGLVAGGDGELLQGCYDCLLAARERYRGAAVGRERPAILARVLEADLLIALRERELGLPASDALGEARRIAAELPREVEATRYIALVEAIPNVESGMSQREHRAFWAAHAKLGGSRAERAWLARGKLRDPVREYLGLALECSYPLREQAPPSSAATSDPPLIAYRRELCGFGRSAVLEQVRVREPRFVEAALFIASIEIASGSRGEPGHAGQLLTEALGRFPDSAAIVYMLAEYDQFVGDFATALQRYDRLLALVPAHEQAMLGRAICLTNLGRTQDAIDAATRIIERREDFTAEAYYWRAHNRRTLAQLGEARADITAAKQLLTSADVLSLAGIIELEQGDLDPARADLSDAIAADRDHCTARWYLAMVERQRKNWLVAARSFEDAIPCYRDRAKASTQRLPALEALRDPAHRARAVANLRASIEADIKQQHLAALTAASCSASGGDVTRARALLELASADPTLADRVGKLRAWLATHRSP